MAKRFPKQLFVKVQKDGNLEYFTADEDAYALVEMGEKIKVATYQLVEIQDAEGVASLTNRKKAR